MKKGRGRWGVGVIDRLQRAISPMVPVRHTLGKLVSQDGYHGHKNKVPSLYLSLDIACAYKEVGLLNHQFLKLSSSVGTAAFNMLQKSASSCHFPIH